MVFNGIDRNNRNGMEIAIKLSHYFSQTRFANSLEICVRVQR